MRIGKYEIRKPWVKMVDVPIEAELYRAIRKSVLDDVLDEFYDAANKVLENDIAVTEEKSTASVKPSAETYEGDAYCVKCKDKRFFVGVIKTSDSGRRIAMGKCNVCGTKLNRILGKVQ